MDFAASSRVGDSFVGPDGATYEVANVASATVISILPAYKGATVSGAAYAIMPVQGYDKMLSDAFNNLNNQFGPKLAALGTTGNYDVLPVTKGGTGGTTQAAARTGLGLGSSATLDYTGTGAATRIAKDLATMLKVTDGTWRGLGGFLDLRGTYLETGTPLDVENVGFVTGFIQLANMGISAAILPGALYGHLTIVTPLNGKSGIVGQTTIRTVRSGQYETVSYATSDTTWSAWSEPNVRGGANSTITSLSGLTTALSIAQGGTGNNTGTASKLAGAGILGTVSQSGGTPTGSIIEKGSTATGEYTKFADGTMICRLSGQAVIDITAVYGSSKYGLRSWIYPASFVATPSLSSSARNASQLLVGTILDLPEVNMTSSCTFCYVDAGGVGANINTRFTNLAIGRWF
ncbi:hypothetical protein [Pseudomonas gessardii]|uniref:hypothetical protein n=1 Tax=Pseudomonas gessardii TaxID=78544 RepID=UPI0030B8BE0E